ncbi:hypothetical protein DPMN_094779 [Dreissena polymorpha]|uniref:Mitochondria-eating protein C-terminal domain-containing protein n=1 Tax=Dreissena polymorpha TaxID=45954 RepID=A0A9D4L5B6_DREPO|nr:hypothetical protein DPMN_094779 [Dreissena polymorpha]
MNTIDFDLYTFGKCIRPFVDECIRVGWLMNLHEPRIEIKPNVSHRSVFDGNLYERWQSIGDRVEFVAWPALIYESGTVVAKGFVKCFNPDMNLQQRKAFIGIRDQAKT